MQQLEMDDIQGLVIRGYGNLSAACYLLLQIVDRDRARQWLNTMTDQLTTGNVRPDTHSLNLALSYPGLRALGLETPVLQGFSEDFQAGMTTPHKQRALGDSGANAPDTWAWGGTQSDAAEIHLLLLVYAVDETALDTLTSELQAGFDAGGVKQIYQPLNTVWLSEPKEHFGFRDGISQPLLEGLPKAQQADNPIPAGEFILGYRNAYGRYNERPLVRPDDPLAGELPVAEGVAEEDRGKRDLGKNGSYLVFRQLQQDVKGFWDFIRQAAARDASGDPDASIRLAAKMVGRWPSGAPVTRSPERDDTSLSSDNSFNYHQDDARGLKCPLGAHIRRTHPRDSLEPEPGTQKSLDFADRHRILRRGRVYGVPLAASMRVEEIMDAEDQGDAERGLHFICLNGNIGRQFEFVQQTWANDPRFNGLYHDPDPLIGSGGDFTEQACPVRKKVHDLPQFVRVRGGGYFFLPGIKALRYLAAG